MAISFVGSAEGSATNGNDVTLTLPGGMQQDDLVIVAYAIGDNDNLDFNMAMVTAGYTEIADIANTAVGQDVNLGVFYKKMGATPDTTAQVDGQGGADASVAAVAMVFRGVDPNTPFDVASTTANASGTMHPNPPSIDHLNPAGLWTVIAGASAHLLNLGTTSDPYTFPTGYTIDNVQRPGNDTSDVTVGMGYRTNPADPEDPGVMTHSGTDSASYAWCAVTMALRPFVPPAQIDTASVNDADRSIENGYTDATVNFTEAMTTTAAVGGAIRIELTDDGGTNWYATTYRSGSGTATFKVRVARVVNNGDTVQVRYRTAAAGATINAVDDSAECLDETVTATNNLTKRFAENLKDKNNANIASATVGYTFTDISGTWTETTTSAGGWIDVQYTGAGAVGSSQWVSVRKPNTTPTESFVWTFTVK